MIGFTINIFLSDSESVNFISQCFLGYNISYWFTCLLALRYILRNNMVPTHYNTMYWILLFVGTGINIELLRNFPKKED